MNWTLTLLVIAAGLNTGIMMLLALASLIRKPLGQSVQGKSISVIVAAHNEAANLRKLLPALLGQQYRGNFEIVLVLDRCTDESIAVANEFVRDHPHLHVIPVSQTQEGYSPKKYAVAEGIRAARHNLFAFTDADCLPGPKWLTSIDACFDEQTDLVIGVSPAEKRGGFLNLFVRFETFLTAFLYTNTARFGLVYMAVGRNLAYRRSFWEQAGGFGPHAHLLSGDDDLLVNRAALPHRTRVMDWPGSLAPTEPVKTWRHWVRQKMRHISASSGYSATSQAFLALYQISHALFYVSLTLGGLFAQAPVALAAVWGARTAMHILLLAPSASRWNDWLLLPAYPLLDPLIVLYHALLVPAGRLTQPTWKQE